MTYLSLLLSSNYSARCFNLPQQFRSSSFMPLILDVKVRWTDSKFRIAPVLSGAQSWQQYSGLGSTRALKSVIIGEWADEAN
jgi:hypothetical protein